ncbi:MAG TPA: AAA family ATPase [Ktedonobacterales bacterium]|nr:AAA family ATPase [Ktedonobacterales bacterium]
MPERELIVMAELVVFVGLQASGKSTYYRTFLAKTHTLVSKDLMPNVRQRQRRQEELIVAALEAGQSVAVDNTSPTPEDRASLIQIGKRFGATITGYWFLTSTAAALERNRMREGKARVPDVAIYATMKKLAQPTFAEGFDRIFTAQIAANGEFVVDEMAKGE